jgi:hypothetical protein
MIAVRLFAIPASRASPQTTTVVARLVGLATPQRDRCASGSGDCLPLGARADLIQPNIFKKEKDFF